ncbi:hypothetical protein ACH5RR_012951 [Cinchona calisaya]|uniref:FAR1 domain-containing protein n=1 Tax=Cinchona calisaya TaxID=153742 RepID=A0ABD2ZYP5_9GENT
MEQDQFEDEMQTSIFEGTTNAHAKDEEVADIHSGMEFQSMDDAFKSYSDYAHNRGFNVRKHRVILLRKDKSVIGQEFVCSKQGFRSKKYSQGEMPQDQTREGCRALVYVSKKEEAKWIFTRIDLQHNHKLASPYSKKFLRSKRKRTETQRNLIDVLDESVVRPSKIVSVLATQAGGVENLSLIDHDICYLRTKRQKQLEKGDAQLMLQYFQKQQSENRGSFMQSKWMWRVD